MPNGSKFKFLKNIFLMIASVFAFNALLFAASTSHLSQANSENKMEEEVSSNEDLMREHGALRRIILIYREAIRRIRVDEEIDPALIHKSAMIIRNFIENYHEKLEENYLFPLFEKAEKSVKLVSTLKKQHQAGRKLMSSILDITSSKKKFMGQKKHLVNLMVAFIHMYEPHAAREDTVLFPELHDIISEKEYNELGEKFEKEEKRLFGKDGFKRIIAQIAKVEKALNIYKLSEFTPDGTQR